MAAHGLQSYISLIEDILSCMFPYILIILYLKYKTSQKSYSLMKNEE